MKREYKNLEAKTRFYLRAAMYGNGPKKFHRAVEAYKAAKLLLPSFVDIDIIYIDTYRGGKLMIICADTSLPDKFKKPLP